MTLLQQARSLYSRGQLDQALLIAKNGLAIEPQNAAQLYEIAAGCSLALGDQPQAEQFCRMLLTLSPQEAEAHYRLGIVLASAAREEEAESCFRRATQLNPQFAEAYFGLGTCLSGRGLADEAERCLRKALALDPRSAAAHFQLGKLLFDADRHEEAEQCYRRAIALDRSFTEALNNLGDLLSRYGKRSEAEKYLRQAVSSDASFADAYLNLGRLLCESARHVEAQPVYRRALALDPGKTNLLTSAMYTASFACAWDQLDQDLRRLRAHLDQPEARFVDAPPLLSIPGLEPSQIKLATRKYAEGQWKIESFGAPIVRPDAVRDRGRLRIGYLSAHFFEHAVASALAGVLEAHDRGKHQIYGYSYGPEISGEGRIRASCEVFRDFGQLADSEAARKIAADEIDILVDLVGYTSFARPAIGAMRPAPIIINWLGYPGTLGHPRLADYLIGDSIVTPLEHAEHFSETLALMPHCYLPYDRSRIVGERPTREEAGLPEGKFVFCSFSQPYKINPQTFDIWCRLLGDVPDSVLWLKWSSDAATDNLRREAATRGIDPGRLVFARHARSITEHLGRLQLGDLALDTYPYGSHTTGCDMLWTGVPLVTRSGETFASRVAASVLRCIGLPELVAEDWETYLVVARRLALEPERLRAVRERLTLQRQRSPLFDTPRFARDLERLLGEIWRQHRRGVRQAIVLEANGS